MDLSDLRIFRAVVEEGGVTAAAQKLHRVQSSVTTRIRHLEEDLGTSLFIRERKRLLLAPAGRTLLAYAERLLALAEEAETAVTSGTPGGIFRLGAMESTAAVRLPRPISAYTERYPDVTVELQTGNPTQLATAVLTGDVEAAFVAEPVADVRFESVPVYVECPVIITSKTVPPIEDEEAGPDTMLVFEEGCPHRRRLEDWYRSRGDTPARTIELRSYHAMMGCVVAGMGAALLPRSVMDTFPETGQFRVHNLPKGQNEIRTLLIWRRGHQSPNTKALVELLDVTDGGAS